MRVLCCRSLNEATNRASGLRNMLGTQRAKIRSFNQRDSPIHSPSNRAETAYFGYKDISETMGPVETRCPKRIIAAASPLRHPDPSVEGNYAARWRQKCLDQSAAKTRRKTDLVPGATIRLSRTVSFTDGYEGDRFVVEIVKRRNRNHTYFRAPSGGLYRISNIDRIGYRVEAATGAG
jgi:Domain of unknown function (DUF6927)